MNSDIIAKVAVENTVYSFDKEFSYKVPEILKSSCKAGVRVLVPFGRGNRKRQGIILSFCSGDSENLKSIISVLDDEPVLSEEMIKTAIFMKEHYFCTLYDAVKTM